jgi:hypothetical protein
MAVRGFGFNRSIGMLLLAIWLILTGLAAVMTTFAIPPIIMAVIAIIAGILILVGR